MMRSTVKVLIVDDHPLFRDGVHGLLDSVPDMEVVAEATSAKTAIECTIRHAPDVVLMDVSMPDGDGIEATRAVMEAVPQTHVLMLTMVEDDTSVFAAMRAGASGYILKGAGQEEMLRAIRAVAAGEAVFGAGIAERMLSFFRAGASRPSALPELTAREEEIVRQIARGRTNEQIAAELGTRLKTVQNQVSIIFNKLQVADRAQAALRARDAGL